jgi:hypothetical protein
MAALVRRFSAVILTEMFVSAVFDFGKIDLIGHSLIVVALIGIIAYDGGKSAQLRDSWLLPLGYAAALVLVIATYYTAHAGLFGTSIL